MSEKCNRKKEVVAEPGVVAELEVLLVTAPAEVVVDARMRLVTTVALEALMGLAPLPPEPAMSAAMASVDRKAPWLGL